jgi:hypothetical protein
MVHGRPPRHDLGVKKISIRSAKPHPTISVGGESYAENEGRSMEGVCNAREM